MKKRAAALCLLVVCMFSLSACKLQLHPTSCVIESPSLAPFEIIQTLSEEYRADDITLVARNKWW